MKIASTDLAMQARHVAMTRQESSERLRVWRGERPAPDAAEPAPANISAAARHLLAEMAAVPPGPTFETAPEQAQVIESASEAAARDPFLALVKRMVEMLTGKSVRVFDAAAFSAELRQVEQRTVVTGQQVRAAGEGRSGWGMEYDAYHLREEFEQTSFAAAGTIRTADGQEIAFRLELQMTRYYREESSVSIRAGDAVRKDPLVINFDGTAAQLARQAGRTFLFDLDDDGTPERLPLFASASGYLALDRDGNGRIDSGRELFGPRTGQGFGELAVHDLDGNGWIDANDPVFGKLFVWTPDAEGAGALRSLASLGVGAITLAHVATPFALRGPNNADLGFVKNTGLYLDRDGRAGSMQEIDLSV